jgi:hypothetical protein
MTQPANAAYPLFIVLDDRSVFLVKTESDLAWFEQIDIENGEYGPCWDRDGRPLQLTWHSEACVEPLVGSAEPSAIVQAIRNWAELDRVDLDPNESDPIALWEGVDAALRQRSHPARAFRFIRDLVNSLRRREP